jgi:hypothetical protein
VLQSFVGSGVGTEFGIEVTEDSDANGVAHVVIVLERASEAGGAMIRRLVPSAAEAAPNS